MFLLQFGVCLPAECSHCFILCLCVMVVLPDSLTGLSLGSVFLIAVCENSHLDENEVKYAQCYTHTHTQVMHRASFYSFFSPTLFQLILQKISRPNKPAENNRECLQGFLLFQGNHMAELGTETDSEDGTVVQKPEGN